MIIGTSELGVGAHAGRPGLAGTNCPEIVLVSCSLRGVRSVGDEYVGPFIGSSVSGSGSGSGSGGSGTGSGLGTGFGRSLGLGCGLGSGSGSGCRGSDLSSVRSTWLARPGGSVSESESEEDSGGGRGLRLGSGLGLGFGAGRGLGAGAGAGSGRLRTGRLTGLGLRTGLGERLLGDSCSSPGLRTHSAP